MFNLFKLFRIGNHPQSRMTLYRVLLHPRASFHHYRTCEDNCFSNLFYGEVPRALAVVCLFIGFRGSGGISSALLWIALAWALWLVAVFAGHVYGYADEKNEIRKIAALKSRLKELTMTILAEGKLTGMDAVMQEALKRAGVSPEHMQDGNVSSFVLEMPKHPRDDEDPIARVMRESNELYRQQAGKKPGGSGSSGGPLPS